MRFLDQQGSSRSAMTRMRSPTGRVSSPKMLSTVVLNPASEVATQRSSSVTPSGRRASTSARSQLPARVSVSSDGVSQTWPPPAPAPVKRRIRAQPPTVNSARRSSPSIATRTGAGSCHWSDRSRLAGWIEKQETRSTAGPRAGQQQGAVAASEVVRGEALRVRAEDPGEVDRQAGAHASPELQGRAIGVENRKRAADRGEPIPGQLRRGPVGCDPASLVDAHEACIRQQPQAIAAIGSDVGDPRRVDQLQDLQRRAVELRDPCAVERPDGTAPDDQPAHVAEARAGASIVPQRPVRPDPQHLAVRRGGEEAHLTRDLADLLAACLLEPQRLGNSRTEARLPLLAALEAIGAAGAHGRALPAAIATVAGATRRGSSPRPTRNESSARPLLSRSVTASTPATPSARLIQPPIAVASTSRPSGHAGRALLTTPKRSARSRWIAPTTSSARREAATVTSASMRKSR